MEQNIEFKPIKIFEVCDDSDLEWLAGCLDGEGCFKSYVMGGSGLYPLIGLTNTDKGLVGEVARILGTNVSGPVVSKRGHSDIWQLKVYGKKAYEWTQKLLPYMRGPNKIADMIELLELHRAKYER